MKTRFPSLCVMALAACLLTLWCGVHARAAEAANWVETADWQGRGTATSQPFYINSKTWRLKYSPKGEQTSGPAFWIEVGSTDGRVLAETGLSKRLVPGWRTFRDVPSFRFLRIHADTDTRWQVVVEQYLTVKERWGLTRKQKETVPVLHKTGTWAGGEGENTYSVDITARSWRLDVANPDEGTLRVTLQQEDGGVAADMVLEADDNPAWTWGYAPGTYTLVVTSTAPTWSVNLFTTSPTEQ